MKRDIHTFRSLDVELTPVIVDGIVASIIANGDADKALKNGNTYEPHHLQIVQDAIDSMHSEIDRKMVEKDEAGNYTISTKASLVASLTTGILNKNTIVTDYMEEQTWVHFKRKYQGE